MTGNQVITEALRVLKIVRFPGQSASTDQLSDGLTFLNNLVDSWSTQRLLIPVVNFSAFTLTANQGEYGIGTGATAPFNVSAPIRIDSAGIVQTSLSGTVYLRTPLQIISQSEYVAIADKTATGDVPEKLYFEPDPGIAELFLWPIPLCSTQTQLELSTWTALSQFPDSTSPGTNVNLRPGYARALIYNLALEMVDAYEGAQLSQADASHAAESKQYVMMLNSLMVPQVPDLAIPPATSAPFEPVPATLKAVAQAKFGGGAPAGTGA